MKNRLVFLATAVGMVGCNGVCLDVGSDTANCGARGNACANGAVGVAGVCTGGEDGEYGPDASRAPWRVATDHVWHGERSAITFLDAVSSYVDSHGGIQRLFAPASNYRGALAVSGWHQDSATAQEYTNAGLLTSVDDTSC